MLLTVTFTDLYIRSVSSQLVSSEDAVVHGRPKIVEVVSL